MVEIRADSEPRKDMEVLAVSRLTGTYPWENSTWQEVGKDVETLGTS